MRYYSPHSVNLLLVRHGQTDWNTQRRFLGQTDIPLNSTGRAQAKSFSDSLTFEFNAAYSSPLLRAQETANAIHHTIFDRQDLAELNQGDLEGLQAKEALNAHPAFFAEWATDPETVMVPNGESLGMCRDRGMRCVEVLCGRHRPGEVVLVVSHQMVLSSLLCTIAGAPLHQWRSFRFNNLGAAWLCYNSKGFEIAATQWKP